MTMSKKKLLLFVLAAALLAAAALFAKRQYATRATNPSSAAAAAGEAAAPGRAAATPAPVDPAESRGSRSVPSATGSTASAVPATEFSSRDLLVLAPLDVARRIPVTGSLRPVSQTVMKSKVAGEIRELLVREGIEVKAGQLVARIDPTEFEWRVKEREAQLRSAEAQLAQARRTFENNRQLLEKNFISHSAFDNGRFTLDSAQGNRDAAVAQLTMARKALTDSVLKAPMAGTIGERYAQVGEKVSPDNRIVSIIDLSRMEIEVPVPASEIGAVEIGQIVSLAIEGVDTPAQGRVVRISPGTQSGTRSVPVYLELENRDRRVRAGLFAQGQLMVGARRGVVAVPETAIRDSGGRQFVYRIEGERIQEREVGTGLRDDSSARTEGGSGLVEITRGLSVGDRIVAQNLGPLRAGSPIKIVEHARP